MESNKRSKLVDQVPSKPSFAHAIETAYRNFLFRSRLEAKYAAFFDLCGWPWSYEPKDYGGWIPDFAIGTTATLVEVKPFFHEEQWDETVSKIIASGCREPVILLGADPTWNLERRITGQTAPQFGEFLLEYFDRGDRVLGMRWDLHFGVTAKNGLLGLCMMDGGWWNPIWDFNEDDATVRLDYRDCEKILVTRWAKAHNASRWMKVKHEN